MDHLNIIAFFLGLGSELISGFGWDGPHFLLSFKIFK
jgi:hypothetical protein